MFNLFLRTRGYKSLMGKSMWNYFHEKLKNDKQEKKLKSTVASNSHTTVLRAGKKSLCNPTAKLLQMSYLNSLKLQKKNLQIILDWILQAVVLIMCNSIISPQNSLEWNSLKK